jgi:hypothetical protein
LAPTLSLEPGVPYTVWSNDRLVGESALDYLANTSQHKMGDFTATEYGEQLIPILMAPRKAVCAHAELEQVELLYTRRETIPLELRGPDGRVIPTDHIEITDLEWLLSLTPVAPQSDDTWESDVELAESEFIEELQPEDEHRDVLKDLLPPEWTEPAQDPLRFDEFDIPDLEFGEIVDDPNAPPPEFPRYQIQVEIKNGG